MSLTTLSRLSAEDRITRTVSSASVGSDMSSSSLLNPITPLSGVRIPWLESQKQSFGRAGFVSSFLFFHHFRAFGFEFCCLRSRTAVSSSRLRTLAAIDASRERYPTRRQRPTVAPGTATTSFQTTSSPLGIQPLQFEAMLSIPNVRPDFQSMRPGLSPANDTTRSAVSVQELIVDPVGKVDQLRIYNSAIKFSPQNPRPLADLEVSYDGLGHRRSQRSGARAIMRQAWQVPIARCRPSQPKTPPHRSRSKSARLQ